MEYILRILTDGCFFCTITKHGGAANTFEVSMKAG